MGEGGRHRRRTARHGQKSSRCKQERRPGGQGVSQQGCDWEREKSSRCKQGCDCRNPGEALRFAHLWATNRGVPAPKNQRSPLLLHGYFFWSPGISVGGEHCLVGHHEEISDRTHIATTPTTGSAAVRTHRCSAQKRVPPRRNAPLCAKRFMSPHIRGPPQKNVPAPIAAPRASHRLRCGCSWSHSPLRLPHQQWS